MSDVTFESIEIAVGAIADRINTNADESRLNFAESFDVIADMLCVDHAGFFANESDPNGDAWKPLHPKTVDSRFLRDIGGKTKEAAARAAGWKPDDKILVDSGAMQSSVRFRGNKNHVEEFGALAMDWGTKDPKAAIHEFGAISEVYNERDERLTTIEIPPRPFVGWSLKAVESALNTVADQAVELILVGF